MKYTLIFILLIIAGLYITIFTAIKFIVDMIKNHIK